MVVDKKNISLDDIAIRCELKSGDLGYITYLHGLLYKSEFGYGIPFEAYVAKSLGEFYEDYDPSKDRVWICEHDGNIVGSLFLRHDGDAAQLRYFLINPDYRGLGLGKKLMDLYMDYLQASGYSSSYLWTTHELSAAASLYKRHGFALVEEKPSSKFGKQVKMQKYELIMD
jgi:peptidyl-dipeptidase Dcp